MRRRKRPRYVPSHYHRSSGYAHFPNTTARDPSLDMQNTVCGKWLSVNQSLRSVASTGHRIGVHPSSKPVRPCGPHSAPNSRENTKLKSQILKLVLIPHAFCYGLCTPLHGFRLTCRWQKCLSVNANPPANVCISRGGGAPGNSRRKKRDTQQVPY